LSRMSEPFSLACAVESIARVPIPRSSLCFFLWHQRKKKTQSIDFLAS
jgi:hypothetical protein